MNPCHNQSNADLVDEYGTLKVQADALDERIKAIRCELVARGAERVEGEKFTVTVGTSTRTTYDDKAIREALGPEIGKRYERVARTVTLRVKPTLVFGQVA
jgi:hypothetical protein